MHHFTFNNNNGDKVSSFTDQAETLEILEKIEIPYTVALKCKIILIYPVLNQIVLFS